MRRSDASLARLAGAQFQKWPGGTMEVRRVVLGGKAANEDAIRREVRVPEEAQSYFEYALSLKLPDTGWPAIARLNSRLAT